MNATAGTHRQKQVTDQRAKDRALSARLSAAVCEASACAHHDNLTKNHPPPKPSCIANHPERVYVSLSCSWCRQEEDAPAIPVARIIPATGPWTFPLALMLLEAQETRTKDVSKPFTRGGQCRAHRGATSRPLTKQQREAQDRCVKDIVGIAHDDEARPKTQAKRLSSVNRWRARTVWERTETRGEAWKTRAVPPTADPFSAFTDVRLPFLE